MPDECDTAEFRMVDGETFHSEPDTGRGREYLDESFEQTGSRSMRTRAFVPTR